MTDYIYPGLTLHWQSAGEETITWVLGDDDGMGCIIWQVGGTGLAVTHIETNYRTEGIRVLLTIGDNDLSLWVPLGELIDYMPPEVTTWIIDNAPLTDEERPDSEESS